MGDVTFKIGDITVDKSVEEALDQARSDKAAESLGRYKDSLNGAGAACTSTAFDASAWVDDRSEIKIPKLVIEFEAAELDKLIKNPASLNACVAEAIRAAVCREAGVKNSGHEGRMQGTLTIEGNITSKKR